MRRIQAKNLGFSLVEIALVVVVIGILASIAVTRYTPLQKSAKRAACLSSQKSIEEAQKLFYSRVSLETGKGAYAETLDELAPFLKDDAVPVCPDGFAYELLPNGGVRCTSPDHQR
ncbi:type II secretion system protein [bacterium]|nr:type II secretion system protein [bacterium]